MILGTGFGSRFAFRIALIGMILTLCLCVNSWGACTTYEDVRCYGAYTCGGYACTFDVGCSNLKCVTYTCGGTDFVWSTGYGSKSCVVTGNICSNRSGFVACDTQDEADSVFCEINPSDPSCDEDDVPDICQEQYSQCMGLGGVWEKIGSDAGGCSSTCDICNSRQQVNNLNRLNRVCCALGLAPPPQDAICVPPPVFTGYGMSTSILLDDGYETGCGALSTADGQTIQENAELFKRFCEDGEEYVESTDSNEPGSSSSAGNSSSAGEGESASSSADAGTNCVGDECLPEIYGVLDTIRDTLIYKIGPSVKGIEDCLYSFRLCAQLDSIKIDWSKMPKDSSWLHIDTTLLKYIKPLMDSSVALDSNQLKVLKNLDTNMLKQMGLDTAMLKLDSAMLRNDSSTRKAIVSGDSGIMKRVGHVDTSVRRLDSSLTKSIGTLDTSLTKSLGGIDTTLHGLDSSLNRGVRDGVDSLIDSMSKYIGRADSSIRGIGGDGTPLGDSLGSIHGAIDGVVNSLDSSIRFGYGSADTGSGNFPWISQGESQRDSILGGGPGGTGFGGLDFGGDSVWMDSMENLGYVCDGDSCCIGDKCEYFESDSMIVDSLKRHAQRLGDSVRALNDAFYRDSVDDIFTEVKDSLRAFNPLHIFDSTLLSELGASIPNSNTCPEHCSTFQVDIPFFFGTQHAVIDWGLCMGRTAFANGNVLSFLRFIIRIIVAVTCITAVMWNATRIRR